MANETKSDKKAEKTEQIAGRTLVLDGKGGGHWQDTGEVVSTEHRAFLLEIAAGDNGLDFKSEQRQNPDLLFYAYEVQLKEGEDFVKNPIRGIVTDMFQRPENFNTGGSSDDADDDTSDRLRVACFMTLTRPCWVKTRGKKVRRAEIGETVWVDINQATASVVDIARPRRDPKTNALVGLAEVAIEPKLKEPFTYVNKKTGKSTTRQAWRCNVYGGFNAGPGSSFKKYIGADEIQRKLGAFIATPSLFNEEKMAKALGIALPSATEVPALPPASN